jgi:TonB family protein
MHPELQAPWNELNVTLAANVRESLAASNWPTAVDWLAGLEQMDADAELLAALNVEMSVARRQAEFLEAAVPADELKLIEFRAPVYPEAARRKELEGWVDVEYIVGRDGRTREVTVLAAEPSGTFDRAATHAVSRFRYETFEEDGVSYDRRVWQRLRFTLE